MATRQYFVAFALMLGLAKPVLAHPGVGIVVDSRGNVFYTDLRHVWRQAPNGSLEIAVRDVHTHELLLTRGDTLYGEHLWYEGGVWHHRIWRREPNGRVDDVIPARSGFRDDYDDFHFVRDSSGAMHWADQGATGTLPQIRTRLRAGPARTLAAAPDGHVGWLAASKSGTVFFISGGDLYRVVDGSSEAMARDVSEHSAVPWHVRFVGWMSGVLRRTGGPDHDVAGLWLDDDGNIYVAVPGGAMVKRITPRGEMTVVARGSSEWTVVGGTTVRGQLWLLETGADGRARARRATM